MINSAPAFLRLGNALNGRILVCDSAAKGLHLCLNANLLGLKSGVAYLKMNHRFAGLTLDLSSQRTYLTDGGRAEVHDHKPLHGGIECLFAYREHDQKFKSEYLLSDLVSLSASGTERLDIGLHDILALGQEQRADSLLDLAGLDVDERRCGT